MIYCKDCRYIVAIPVDGPAMTVFKCKKIKCYTKEPNPINCITLPVYCDPYKDNITNDCKYFEEKKRLLNKLFNWSW